MRRTEWKRAISLSLSKEALAYLKEKAKAEDKSRSEIVEKFIEYAINHGW
jgi:hypothetical protein